MFNINLNALQDKKEEKQYNHQEINLNRLYSEKSYPFLKLC